MRNHSPSLYVYWKRQRDWKKEECEDWMLANLDKVFIYYLIFYFYFMLLVCLVKNQKNLILLGVRQQICNLLHCIQTLQKKVLNLSTLYTQVHLGLWLLNQLLWPGSYQWDGKNPADASVSVLSSTGRCHCVFLALWYIITTSSICNVHYVMDVLLKSFTQKMMFCFPLVVKSCYYIYLKRCDMLLFENRASATFNNDGPAPN